MRCRAHDPRSGRAAGDGSTMAVADPGGAVDARPRTRPRIPAPGPVPSPRPGSRPPDPGSRAPGPLGPTGTFMVAGTARSTFTGTFNVQRSRSRSRSRAPTFAGTAPGTGHVHWARRSPGFDSVGARGGAGRTRGTVVTGTGRCRGRAIVRYAGGW
jgi:hypothetical protein